MDLTKVDAATEQKLVHVQAGIRGYLTRKHLATQKAQKKAIAYPATRDSLCGDASAAQVVTPSIAEHSVSEEAASVVLDLSKVDTETEQKLVQVQAGIRGHLTRKQLATERAAAAPTSLSAAPQSSTTSPEGRGIPEGIQVRHADARNGHPKKPEVVVDLSKVDAETERKLVQVQAGIRGYLTRKHMARREATLTNKSRPSLPVSGGMP
jgi:5-hydroxyisourate hydrolase-like protein (transthyretin family)